MNIEEVKELQSYRYKCTDSDFVADELRVLHKVIAQLKKRIEILEEEVKPRERFSTEEFAKMKQFIAMAIAENESKPKP